MNYVIGDCHTNVFAGVFGWAWLPDDNDMFSLHKNSCDCREGWKTYWTVGNAFNAFSTYKEVVITLSKELNSNNNLFFSWGETDARTELYHRRKLGEINVIETCVSKYTSDFLSLDLRKDINYIFLGATPEANHHIKESLTPEILIECNGIKKEFNHILKNFCVDKGFFFVDIWDFLYENKTDDFPNLKWYSDSIHLIPETFELYEKVFSDVNLIWK